MELNTQESSAMRIRAKDPRVRDLGNFVRDRREASGWSRADLADKAGLSAGTIKFLETARHSPTKRTCLKLVAIRELGLSRESVAFIAGAPCPAPAEPMPASPIPTQAVRLPGLADGPSAAPTQAGTHTQNLLDRLLWEVVLLCSKYHQISGRCVTCGGPVIYTSPTEEKNLP